MDSKPLAHVPLSVFSKSSSLMSDRASQAMEKALRNKPRPSEENVVDVVTDSHQRPEKDVTRLAPPPHQESFPGRDHANNFGEKDVAELLTASSFTNDKHGTMTYTPVYRREGAGDLTHFPNSAGQMFRDGSNEDGNGVRSVTVTGPSGSERSVGSGAEADGERSNLLENCAKEDLDLVEGAILRLIYGERHVSRNQNQEDSQGALESTVRSEGTEGSSLSAAEDLELLSRLLGQVQSLRAQQKQGKQRARATRSRTPTDSISWDITKRPGSKEKRSRRAEMKNMVETAAQAAKSAAEAAKAAADSVAKSSEAIEKVLATLSPSLSATIAEQIKHRVLSQNSQDSEDSSESENVKKIAKKIVIQNRYTHVVLGVILVSSFVWRYVVVKVAKRLKNKVTDPWGYVGGMFKGPGNDKETTADGTSKGPRIPQIKLPSLLHNENSKEQDLPSATVTESNEESSVLNFRNILQIKPDSQKSVFNS